MQELRKKIIEAAKQGNHAAVYACFEVQAAGVYRVIQIANSKPSVCISASRRTNSVEENNKNNEALLQRIKAANLFAYQMIGGFEETDEETKRGVHVIESSFFVPLNEEKMTLKEFITFFKDLQKEYNQDAILLGLPESYDYEKAKAEKPITGHFFLYQNGQLERIGSKATIQAFDKYGSIVYDPKKNRILEWVIAGVTTPNGPHSCFAMKRAGLKWFWDDKDSEPVALNSNSEIVVRALKKICKC